MAENWFQDAFGAPEAASFKQNRAAFALSHPDDPTPSPSTSPSYVLRAPNGQSFHVGQFTIPTVDELEAEMNKYRGALSPPDATALGTMTFGNVVGVDIRSVIQHPTNAGSVIQVASQFNCLEMVGPGVRPEDGVARYASDPTQGPACALACPAGTVFRNYFASPTGTFRVGTAGQGGGDAHQLNGLMHVERLLDNDKNAYWHITNGYLLPKTNTKMAELTTRILQSGPGGLDAAPLGRSIVAKTAVGVHWDTEVRCSSQHRVAQVFCSAVPVTYAKSTGVKDWSTFACLALEALYEATILVGAVLAYKEKRRVTVYLTNVGGSAFGNMHAWIARGQSRAMEKYHYAPVDVRLAHYGSTVRTASANVCPKNVKEFKKPFHGVSNSGIAHAPLSQAPATPPPASSSMPADADAPDDAQ